MKRYGYHRTSTREQHLDRGIKEITAYCEQNNLELEKIFTDQQTGKNFNRPRYQVLKEDVSRAGDKLIITEVDNFTSYKNYNIWLIELKRNISGKVICVTRGDTNWKDKSGFVERFLELSLFYRLFSPLDSEMICIFPYFCPYAESAREIREIFV